VFTIVFEYCEFTFKLSFRSQCFVPATFKFRSNEPIRGIHRIILATRMGHFIARLFQRQLLLMNALVAGIIECGDRGHCRIDAQRRQALQQLLRYQAIGAQSAEQHTGGLIGIQGVTGTLISDDMRTRILRQQLGATVTTAKQPGEQSLAVLNCSTQSVALRVFVVGNHRLIALIHVPINVTLMMIQNQYRPVFTAAPHLPLNLLACFQARYQLALSIRVCAGIDRVFQHAEN